MRIWEIIEESNLPQSDLVREQDFILRVRRMQRHATPHLVINLILSAVEAFTKHKEAMEAVQLQLQELVKASQGMYAEMSNGDVFIVWEESAGTQPLPARIMSAILPDVKDTTPFLLTYHMPKDYTSLRERTNHYVELAQSAATLGNGNSPGQALRSEAARGGLTPWSVDQVGRLLGEIDLRRYGRTQPIYHHEKEGIWKPVSEEYFVSFEDLRREHFPKIDLVTPEHLFLSLCEMLDQRLLAMLTEKPETVTGRAVWLNLSVRSIMGSVFTQFIRQIPRDKRDLMGFELHRGDLFQNFSLTLDAISVLQHEGFKVAIDSITPDMGRYLNMAEFNVDHIKINVSKDRAAQLDDPAIRKELARVPPEKLVFFRCDNERALTVGLDLGVSLFQGWLIDDAAKGKSGR